MNPLQDMIDRLVAGIEILDERAAPLNMELRGLGAELERISARIDAIKSELSAIGHDRKELQDTFDALSVVEFQTDVFSKADALIDTGRVKHLPSKMTIELSGDATRLSPSGVGVNAEGREAVIVHEHDEQPENLADAIAQQRGIAPAEVEPAAEISKTEPENAPQTSEEKLGRGEMMDLVREAAKGFRAFTIPQIVRDMGIDDDLKRGNSRVRSGIVGLVKAGEVIKTGDLVKSEFGGRSVAVFMWKWAYDEEIAKRRSKKPARARPKGETIHIETKGGRGAPAAARNTGSAPKLGDTTIDAMIKRAWDEGWHIVSRVGKVFVYPPNGKNFMLTKPRRNADQVHKKMRSEFRRGGLSV